MNTLEINKALRSIKDFIGAFPKDMLPKITKRPAFLIINTHNSTMPGEHWTSVALLSDGTGEYFDSFGIPPIHELIVKYLFENCPNGLLYNTVTLQNVNTITCGLFCVNYVESRVAGITFCSFVNKF